MLGPQFEWARNPSIRPYFSIRQDTRAFLDKKRHSKSLDSLGFGEPLYLDPFNPEDMKVLNGALGVDRVAFAKTKMVMPSWVFYDCGVIPGVVSGFAAHRSFFSQEMLDFLGKSAADVQWIPLSLFIMIPSLNSGEWIAHNLCSLNFTKKISLYGLAFMSKLFGLLYAGAQSCIGITQWSNFPALKLHSMYGPFQVSGAYTTLHTHQDTLTYRLQVDDSFWRLFFDKESIPSRCKDIFEPSKYKVDPRNTSELLQLHNAIQNEKLSLYLNPMDLRDKTQEIFSLYFLK